jgi:ABC-2 type transport system permease protein
MMNPFLKLFASVVKEFRIIARDRAGLALLFVMPLGFVTVMSLALQDVLGQPDAAARLQFSIVVLDGDAGEVGRAIEAELANLDFVQVTKRPFADFQQAGAGLREQVRTGQERLALIIPERLSARLDEALANAGPGALFDAPAGNRIALDLLVDPALRADFRLLVTIAIERILQGVELRRAMARFAGGGSPPASTADTAATPHRGGVMRVNDRAIQTNPARNPLPAGAPTSAQQNVPAYCLLAIFMLVVPLSQTFIKERAQGSLTRLRSMPVPGWVIIGGKFVPYFLINLLQMALCLGVGRFVLPLLGGTALRFEHALGGVMLLSAAASVAAIAFALMVALFARTAEQATAFGATAILLLAALGGIMVPRTLMPPVLQKIGLVSPLGWAQDGFLDLFVRGAGAADVLDRVGGLLAFGLVCMVLAGWRFATLDRQ